MQIDTHQTIDRKWCGEPIEVSHGRSLVAFEATAEMAVDATGLTHGGFIFGLADHAAMIAVNHPNVVLGSAEAKFLKPVQTGDKVIAEAQLIENWGKKQIVRVSVTLKDEAIFEGRFTCFSLDYHVLNKE